MDGILPSCGCQATAPKGNNMAIDTNQPKSKREPRITRYLLNDGSDEPTGRAQENTHTIGFHFVKNDEEIKFDLAKVFVVKLP